MNPANRFKLAVSMLAVALISLARADISGLSARVDTEALQRSRSGAFTITLKNLGPDISGRLTYVNWSLTTICPFVLKTGESKRIELRSSSYFNEYGDRIRGGPRRETAQITTDRGSEVLEWTGRDDNAPSASSTMMMISRPAPKDSALGKLASISGVYAIHPADVPQVAGSLDSPILLEQGAEDMSDAAFDTVMKKVLMGGRLIVAGGKTSPLFKDHRLKKLVGSYSTSSYAGRVKSKIVKSLGMKGLSEPVGLPELDILALNGTRSSDNTLEEGKVLEFRCSFGQGSIQVLAFDPAAEDLKKWVGLPGFVRSLADNSAFEKAYEDTAYIYGEPPSGMKERTNRNWLNLKPASSTSLAVLLVGYFVVVIPLNFWLLGRVRRREFAWVTAPLLAIAFAFATYSKANALAGVKSCSGQDIRITADAKWPDAPFQGEVSMYTREATTVKPQMKSVESLSATYQYSGLRRSQLPSTQILDGQAQLAPFQSNPYEARSYDVAGTVPNNFVRLRRTDSGVEVTANTRIESAYLATREGVYEVGNLAKGEKKLIAAGNPIGLPRRLSNPAKVTIDSTTSVRFKSDGWHVPMNGVRQGKMALSGLVPDLELGLYFAERHPNNMFVYTAEDLR